MTDKVSIFYTNDGREWAEYLKEKLAVKERAINTELYDLLDKNIEVNSKVNVFLVSPDFLDLKSWDILGRFDSKTVVAVLAGVDHNDWLLAAEKHGVESVLEWLDYELEASDKSVRDLLVSIIGIYELREEFGDDVDAAWNNYMNVPSFNEGRENEETFYKTLPSRPSRQVNAVNHVFRKDDNVFLLLERMAEGTVQVSFHGDGRCLNPAFEGNYGLYSFPWKATNQDTFDIMLNGEEIGFGEIEALDKKQTVNTESVCDLPPPPARHSAFSSVSTTSAKSVSYYYNEDDDEPYDYPPPRRYNIPSSYSASSESSSIISDTSYLNPKAFKNSEETRTTARDATQSCAKPFCKLEQIRKLLEEETDPVSVLCGCLSIPKSVSALDDKLTSMIQPVERLKEVPFPTVVHENIVESGAHWPTLVHFGAEFNLFKFCDSLLISPIMHGACRTKNSEGQFPHDVASTAGHKELSQALKAFCSQISQGQTGSHDSGFSQCVRLSNVSVSDSTIVPPPHRSVDSHYMDMAGNLEEPRMSLEIPSCRPPPPSFTTDGEKTPTATIADIFQGTVFSRQSAFDGHGVFNLENLGEKSDSSSNDSKGTVKGEDSNSEEPYVQVHQSPSETEVISTKDPRKSGGFSLGKFFRKKKQRSFSEPAMHPEEEAVRRKQKTKIYRKGSEKTDSSTSGYSTYSESSGRASEELETYKGSKTSKKKNKDRLKLILTNVQRRNSVRIDHVLRDENLTARIPLPGKSNDESF